MTDLLAQGQQWLDEQRHQHLSRPVTYHRGELPGVELQATVGRTVFHFDVVAGVTARYVSRDFLIRVEDLALDGETVLPKRGDRIREVQGERVFIHEVMGPGREEPDWRYSDPNRTTFRIHTKQVGEEAAT